MTGFPDWSNWYWVVGGSTTQVYSTAASNYVPLSDPAYQAWLQININPSQIDTETNLWAILTRIAPNSLPAGNAAAAQIRAQTEIGSLALAELKVLFWLVNQVRALQSQTPLTKAQFIAAITNLATPQ